MPYFENQIIQDYYCLAILHDLTFIKPAILFDTSKSDSGVVGCGEGVGYLMPLILASSWARPAKLVAGRVEGI